MRNGIKHVQIIVVFYIILILSAIFGLFIGSFLNVVADRLCQERDPFKGRSMCDFCGKVLKPRNLIPLLSYLIQRGRCPYCGKKLSLYYPFSELLTALFFALAAYASGFAQFPSTISLANYIYLLVVFSVYVTIFLSDIKYQLIPDKVIFFGIIFISLSLIGYFAVWSFHYRSILQSDPVGSYFLKSGYYVEVIERDIRSFLYRVLTGLGISAFFYSLVKLTRERGMGGGDVKLGLMLGLFNGFPNGIIAMFIAFIVGSFASLGMIAFSKKGLKDVIPFGPFFNSGQCAIFIVWGLDIYTLYFILK